MTWRHLLPIGCGCHVPDDARDGRTFSNLEPWSRRDVREACSSRTPKVRVRFPPRPNSTTFSDYFVYRNIPEKFDLSASIYCRVFPVCAVGHFLVPSFGLVTDCDGFSRNGACNAFALKPNSSPRKPFLLWQCGILVLYYGSVVFWCSTTFKLSAGWRL